MQTFLTKSLFVEFTSNPKLAWWHANVKDKYLEIMDSIYGSMDGVAIGQAVEDMVLATFGGMNIATINTDNMRSNRHATYHDRTMEVMKTHPEIIYQPSFLIGDVFVKCDMLVRNSSGQYDLIEVKAKNSIRKKTKAEPLLDDLIADVSIQAYVLKKLLGDRFSGNVSIAHLDSDYVKCGEINPSLLVKKEDVSHELMSNDYIEMILKTMRESLSLPVEQFNARYPYDGTDYMTYFGEKPPKNSIWSLTRLSASKRAELYESGKIFLSDFDEFDAETLKNNKGESTRASLCLDLWQNGPEVFDKKAIEEQLGTLTYPLYFYDYETINGPVPLIEGTSPWQQVVVQYSLHKVQADGSISHHEAIIEPGEETNERILKQMIEDMDGVGHGTYIVRYKGFENVRNTERGTMFPEYAEHLERINNQTFDLMEIFSNQLYYHRAFEGSSSIKKVLPVMSEISYEGMAVPNGAVAMDQLMKIASGSLDRIELEVVKSNLLEYCKLDTWAMVAIRSRLKELV